MSTVQKINLREKLDSFTEQWSPKLIAELHGVGVKVVKVEGEFEWHHHDKEDELFWVIRGNLTIHFRDKDVHLSPGELCLIPHGVEHKPEANEECEIVLIEPTETLNTGNVRTDKTVDVVETI